MRNLKNFGVIELDVQSQHSIDGGDIIGDLVEIAGYLIGKGFIAPLLRDKDC